MYCSYFSVVGCKCSEVEDGGAEGGEFAVRVLGGGGGVDKM